MAVPLLRSKLKAFCEGMQVMSTHVQNHAFKWSIDKLQFFKHTVYLDFLKPAFPFEKQAHKKVQGNKIKVCNDLTGIC